jgi:hypothetical protein
MGTMVPFENITILNNRNIKMKGMRTRNHATADAPALHMRFRIHVQNKIYTSLTANTKYVFGTAHSCTPKQ